MRPAITVVRRRLIADDLGTPDRSRIPSNHPPRGISNNSFGIPPDRGSHLPPRRYRAVESLQRNHPNATSVLYLFGQEGDLLIG